MTKVIRLQERLDFGAAPDLKAEIIGQVGNDLEIDASAVTHMGTLCLQILIAASNDWVKNGHRFILTSPSDTCKTQLSLHGFTPDTLTGVTQ